MSVSLEKSSFVYNGQSITPVVYVAYNHNYLIQNTDFTATYSNNNAPGVATVKIKGIGNYSGSISKTYVILPEKIASVSIKKDSATSAVISWSAASKVSGYEILKFDSAKNAYVHLAHVSNSQTSYKASSLKNSTAYYYQVRAYKTVNDKNYYGEVGNTVFTFIKPSKVKLTSVTLSKTTLKVEWKKVNCSGYIYNGQQIQKRLKKSKNQKSKNCQESYQKVKEE